MSQGHIPAGSCLLGLRSPRQLSDPRGQAWLLASPSCHRGQRAGTCHSPCTPHQPRAPPSPRNVRLALQGGHMPGTRGHAQAVTGPAGHRLSPRPPAPGDEVGQPVMALPLPHPPGNLPPGGVQGARQAAQGQGPRPARVPRPLPHSHRTREEAGASEQGAGGRAACCPRGGQSLRDKGPARRQAPLERTFVTTRTSRRAWRDPFDGSPQTPQDAAHVPGAAPALAPRCPLPADQLAQAPPQRHAATRGPGTLWRRLCGDRGRADPSRSARPGPLSERSRSPASEPGPPRGTRAPTQTFPAARPPPPHWRPGPRLLPRSQ